MIKTLTIIYFAFWLVLLGAGLYAQKAFLLSSQLGFFCAIIIACVSFYSYKKRVLKKLTQKDNVKTSDDEKIDKISDEQKDAKTLLNEEKARLKAQKTKLKDMGLGTAFVPYRLFAYAILVAGFILLKRNDLLDIFGLFLGLSIMPFGALLAGFLNKESK